jgi:hypothetical protein
LEHSLEWLKLIKSGGITWDCCNIRGNTKFRHNGANVVPSFLRLQSYDFNRFSNVSYTGWSKSLCTPGNFFSGSAAQHGQWPPRPRGFRDHTQRRATVVRGPLDEWSARRRDLYLTIHNTHNRQTSMPPVGFEPTMAVGERP